MNTLSIIYLFVASLFISVDSTKSDVSTSKPCDCGTYESITTQDVINLDPQGYQEWTESWGPADGTYYYAIVVFSDGTKGKLFRGGNSGRHFVENSNGVNYYYVSLEAAIRALYLYKKYDCLSSKFRL